MPPTLPTAEGPGVLRVLPHWAGLVLYRGGNPTSLVPLSTGSMRAPGGPTPAAPPPHPNSVSLDVAIGQGQGPAGLPGLGILVEAEAEGVADDELLHDEGPAEPGHSVLQGDEAHEVKVELGVVPGAGVELAQDEAGGELPQVGPERVDEAAHQQRAAATQAQVHALHDEDGRAVDEERPHARDPRELPVKVHHELPGRREHHLAEIAMDGVQVPAGQRRQGLGGSHGADWPLGTKGHTGEGGAEGLRRPAQGSAVASRRDFKPASAFLFSQPSYS